MAVWHTRSWGIRKQLQLGTTAAHRQQQPGQVLQQAYDQTVAAGGLATEVLLFFGVSGSKRWQAVAALASRPELQPAVPPHVQLATNSMQAPMKSDSSTITTDVPIPATAEEYYVFTLRWRFSHPVEPAMPEAVQPAKAAAGLPFSTVGHLLNRLPLLANTASSRINSSRNGQEVDGVAGAQLAASIATSAAKQVEDRRAHAEAERKWRNCALCLISARMLSTCTV